jgi:hypothetical protein
MKKIFLFLLPAVALLASCTKNISSVNNITKNPTSVPPGPVFTYAVKQLVDGNADCSVSINIFRHIVEHWGQATNEDGAQYSFNIDNTCDNWWNRLYVQVLSNLKNCDSLLALNTQLQAAAVVKNERAIVDIMEVYAFNELTESFGNVPYSQALNYKNLTPVYDDAKTIQQDLQKRLTADIAALDPTQGSFATTEDLFYSGVVSKWVAFANTLQIKIAMTLADVDDADAKSFMEADNANAFQSPATDAVWQYLAVPNNNPTYQALVLSGRSDYVATTKLINYLVNMSDPRLPGYFGTNTTGQYAGAYIGSTVVFSTVSKPAAALQLATTPYVFMDYMDLEFYRAEAIERGYNIPGTAEQHYDSAIALSIRHWGGTQAQVLTYLARPDVAYTTAPGTWRQKIGFQKWLALYCRGFDGYTELRRFDWPAMDVPTGAVSGFPTRMTYPATIYTEQGLNGANYKAAAAAMGGDVATFKLYWDIN